MPLLLCCTQFIAAAQQQPALTMPQAVQRALDKYPAVRSSMEQVSAAAAGINLARTSYLPRADFLGQVNRATHNNVFGQLFPQSVIPSMTGPVLGTDSGQSVWGSTVDVDKDEIIKTLRFDSETGMPQYDAVARKVYVNLRSTNQVAEIDPTTDRIIGQYPVKGCQFNHGMAIDSERHRAFLLCGKSRTMTVFALDSHHAIAHLPLPSGADVVKFDPGLRRIYAGCSSGVIAVYKEQDAPHFRKIEDFPVQKTVHSLAVDTSSHRVYAPEEEEDGHPVAQMVVYEAVVEKEKK